VEIRQYDDGSIELFGYVNISERNSKILSERGIKFREQIKKGAWNSAIQRNNDIKLLVNHSWDKIYSSTKDNLRLYEDNIGARFSIKTSDEDLVNYAKNGQFKGLSFAFRCNDDDYLNDGAIKLRYVNDMDVTEISLLTVEPAYDGCMVEMRDKDGNILETRDYKVDFEDYSDKEVKILKEIRKKEDLELKLKLLELELQL
jgi:HK97 family phage prohead protease